MHGRAAKEVEEEEDCERGGGRGVAHRAIGQEGPSPPPLTLS